MGKIKSCSECRRLKLKCIREGDSWPCISCRKRQCNEICPDGIATTTEKASSERLLRHYRNKISTLEAEVKKQRAIIVNGRVERREDSSSSGGGGNSRLCEDELMAEEALNAIGEYSRSPLQQQQQQQHHQQQQERHPSSSPAVVVAYSTDGLVVDQRHFHGRSSGAFYTHPVNDSYSSSPLFPSSSLRALHRAKTLLMQIAFDDAMSLLTLYADSVTWMYSPISCTDIHRLARRAYDTTCTTGEMSVVCMALALGNHFKNTLEENVVAVLHPQLYQAGLDCLLCIETLEKPSLEAAAAAHLCTSYLLSQGESGKSQSAWQILGMGIRIAVSMGLHCSQSQWGASSERQEACSWVFWELLVYERFQSLNFGRPGLLPPIIACPRPTVAVDSFHSIKYDLCQLFEQINLLLSQPEFPEHVSAMRLDVEVRNFEARIPAILDLQKDLPDSFYHPHIIAQRHMLSLLIHKALLFLHRPWFARALLHSKEPLFSPLANSFAAAVKSARQHTLVYESALKHNPMISTWWFFVFHLYTAAVVQAQVLIRSSGSLLAAQCQDDFELSYSLLGKASRYSKIAERAFNLLISVRAEILFKYAAASRPQNDAALLAATVIATHSPANPSESNNRRLDDGVNRNTTTTTTGSSSSTTTASTCQQPTPQDQESPYTTQLSEILSADILPLEFTNQSDWMEMDPLLQAAVYWHTQSAAK